MGKHEAENDNTSPNRGSLLSNQAYDALKFIAQIFLPALGALYFGLAQIWGLPAAEEIVGTVAVIDTFLGVLLGISNKAYEESEEKYDGFIDIEEDVMSEKKTFSLVLDSDPEQLENKKEVTFKVNPIV